MEEERKSCDVLCVGGGIAGLMAAIEARESGASVIVVDKANTLRSGMGGMGNDHFQCYIPEVHGDFDHFWRELFYGQLVGGLRMLDTEYVRFWFENSFDIVNLWDKWGIPMKYEGRYEFAGHGYPGKQLNHLKYSGVNQKPVLTRQALERGAEIINRAMVFDLLKGKDGAITGAVGISTREDKFYVFQAKSVFLGTGGCQRLYPSVTVGADNNRSGPYTTTGDGRAMAYRAGAELKNPEIPSRHAGPKYFFRMGQATWVGVLRDRAGRPVGPFLTKPERRYHDMTIETNKSYFEEFKKSGRGPIYMDMDGISKEDLDYMVHWLKNEGNGGLLGHLEDEGIDLGKAAIEFQSSEFGVSAGVRANHRGETTVNGLYAAGDEVFGTISHAAVFGRSSGANAAKYASTVNKIDLTDSKSVIDSRKELLQDITARRNGARWQEALSALQQVMIDYCGPVRSEVMLEAGLDIIKRLKGKARNLLTAGNAHELTQCMQTLNLFDIGELVMTGAYERKETRDLHVRSDYTLTNPLLSDKLHVVKLVDGKPRMEWAEIKR